MRCERTSHCTLSAGHTGRHSIDRYDVCTCEIPQPTLLLPWQAMQCDWCKRAILSTPVPS